MIKALERVAEIISLGFGTSWHDMSHSSGGVFLMLPLLRPHADLAD